MIAQGIFNVSFDPQSGDTPDCGRMVFLKDYAGELIAKGHGQMLSKRTLVKDSAAYVAIEDVDGELNGLTGSFSLYHIGVMNRGEDALSVNIIPDSGTGQLTGIAGKMDISVEEGVHHYRLHYTLPGDSA